MRFENISKIYGDKVVLNNFSADIPENKTTCILGKSGAGKSTLTGIALGIEKADFGKVSFDSPPTFSAVFQDDRLLPFSSLTENITFVGATKEAARNMLAAVGLEKEQDDLPDTLSGGMKRRLALARALCRPGYTHLVLDEPFTGQDEVTKEKLIELIKKETAGKTVILITHNEEDVKRLADNIIRL